MDIQDIHARLVRLEAQVGLSDNDFLTPKRALLAMGYGPGSGFSENSLRLLLKRALYAHQAGLDCPLVLGEHYNALPGPDRTTWTVNWPKLEQLLRQGPGLWAEVPELPEDYGAA